MDMGTNHHELVLNWAGGARTHDPLINQKLRFELKSLTIVQRITYAISAQSDATTS